MRETIKETSYELALNRRTVETIQRHPVLVKYEILAKGKETPDNGEPTKTGLKIAVAG